MATTFTLPGTDRKGSVLVSNSTTEGGRAYTAFGFHPGEREPSTTTAYAGQILEPRLVGYSLGNGTRFYNPRLMRLHTYDLLSPFGEGGINGYAYCNGDPINYCDPSGRFSIWDAVNVFSGVTSMSSVAVVYKFARNTLPTTAALAAISMLSLGASYIKGSEGQSSALSMIGVMGGVGALMSASPTLAKGLKRYFKAKPNPPSVVFVRGMTRFSGRSNYRLGGVGPSRASSHRGSTSSMASSTDRSRGSVRTRGSSMASSGWSSGTNSEIEAVMARNPYVGTSNHAGPSGEFHELEALGELLGVWR